MAAILVHKLPRHRLLHDLLHLLSKRTFRGVVELHPQIRAGPGVEWAQNGLCGTQGPQQCQGRLSAVTRNSSAWQCNHAALQALLTTHPRHSFQLT